jgi:hypothetical protein
LTYRDVFTKFGSDLTHLNPNELTIVTYQPKDHTIAFRQVGYYFIASYLSPFFLPKKKFRIGVLNQTGLNKLKYNLSQLLKNEAIDKLELVPDLEELGTGWYRIFDRNVPIPQKVIKLNYCNITGKFWTWITCNFYNTNSKLLYKLAKSELRK